MNIDHSPKSSAASAASSCYTPDQLARLADVVASGRFDFPIDLSDADKAALVKAVRIRLHRRFLNLLANAIARDIQKEANR